jgi:hypothetical protein
LFLLSFKGFVVHVIIFCFVYLWTESMGEFSGVWKLLDMESYVTLPFGLLLFNLPSL